MEYRISAWAGNTPNTSVASSRMPSWMPKLKIAEPTEASGKISRGR